MLNQIKSLLTFKQAKREASYFSKLEIPYYALNSQENYISNLSRRLPLACACISLRARKVRSTRWRIVETESKKLITNHGIQALLKPNSTQRFSDLLELMVWSDDTVGNSYLLQTNTRNKFDNSLFFLPPQKVIPWTVENMFITKYEFQPDAGEKLVLEPREIIHSKYPSLESPAVGMGLIQTAEILLQKNLNRDSYMESFYKNGTVLSGIFTSDSVGTNTEQRNKMRAEFEEQSTGVKRFFKTFFAWGGYKYQPLSVSHRDSQDVEQTKLTRDDILAVFGVPGALLGYTDGVNFSNAEIQERIFINNTLIPLLSRLEDLITYEIVHQFDNSLSFEFLKPVNENLNLKSAWVKPSFDSGVISKKQYADLMGIIEDGELSRKDKPKA
ncbi:MAG TPA: phage portal protein [Flavobacterium sp.]|nr:phage portal protein [Flavobacterium sp.]